MKGRSFGCLPLSACILFVWAIFSPAQAAVDTIITDTTPPAYRIVTDGPVRLSVRLLPRRPSRPLTIGDRFELELVVKRPRNITVSPPFPADPGDFVVLEQHSRIRYQGDTILDIYRLKLVAFVVGEVKLSPFLVTWQDVTGTMAAASDSLPLKIVSLMPKDMTDINDIKPQVQFPNPVPIWVGLGMVLAAGLGWFGYKLFRRLQKRGAEPAPLPEPWDEALAALAGLPALDWLEAGEVKRLYYAVSEILKRYLTRRYGFPAIDQTTTEIAWELKRQRLMVRDRFVDFFRRADMVKFAKLVPPCNETEAVVAAARALVEATTPKPEEDQAQGAEA
ncbi:MAG: hypothetical protein ABIK44_03905 [candidate division WOR-3 bacterium]